jgi:hypothetical protein
MTGFFAAGNRVALTRLAPWLLLALLLALCAWDGTRAVSGLIRPPDEDLMRDVGFMQAILDGNFFGDAVYRGELRWYPPLISLIGAATAWLTGGPLATVWIQVAPWFGLLGVVLFFGMVRQLFDPMVAATAVAIYALVDPAVSQPWITGGYTPWPLASNLAALLFFVGVWMIHRHGALRRWRDAALIGAVLGLSFLAHMVPALLLSAIVTAVALREGGLHPRTLTWLALVAAVEVTLSLPFLLPLWLRYGLRVANSVPVAWTDWTMLLPFLTWVAQVSAPGVLAIAVAWLLRRYAPIDKRTVVILLAWIGVCAAMLGRHYACQVVADRPAVCRIVVVPVHHFHMYLVVGWTVLVGYAVTAVARAWIQTPRPHGWEIRLAALAVALMPLIAAKLALRTESYDSMARASALADGHNTDWQGYRWILANTDPDDLFVTNGNGRSAFTVYPAARHLMVAPLPFSSPYVEWMPREERRRRLVAAVTGGPADSWLCDPANRGHVWFLFPNDVAVDGNVMEAAFRTEFQTVYRLQASPAPCMEGDSQRAASTR